MKRAAEEAAADDGDSDDDDFGPKPLQEGGDDASASSGAPADGAAATTTAPLPAQQAKPKKKLRHESLYLDNLPSAVLYEKSYMHRDVVSHVAVARSCEFVVTASVDGHVKFWRKMATGIEFVKHFQAHLGPIHALAVSPCGRRLATTSSDCFVKFFEVATFDMSCMAGVDYTPTCAAWICGAGAVFDRLAVGDAGSGAIRVYASDGSLRGSVTLHEAPVVSLCFSQQRGLGVSGDAKGLLEYWDGETLQAPQGKTTFRLKSDTDLYELAKTRTSPLHLAMSPRGDCFAALTLSRQLLLFDLSSGRLRKKYDESAQALQAQTQALGPGADHMQQGRRLAQERDLEATQAAEREAGWPAQPCNLAFDESGNFLLYGAAQGVKVLNLTTNRVSCVLGEAESGERFLALALYQGAPRVDTQFLLGRNPGESGTTTADKMHGAPEADPTVYATSLRRRRFFCLSRRDPEEGVDRDVLNEKPTAEERLAAAAPDAAAAKRLGREAVLRTSKGEITIRLYGAECPRTVENFCQHARDGYYDGVLFHRVIKGFMLQTGDPRGDGTGGESIWGGEFADEIHASLRHNLPFAVSMANAGPNTNGSQFFITTTPQSHLDGKHTVFGRVTKGFEVVKDIEESRCSKYDRPLDEIKILKIDVVK